MSPRKVYNEFYGEYFTPSRPASKPMQITSKNSPSTIHHRERSVSPRKKHAQQLERSGQRVFNKSGDAKNDLLISAVSHTHNITKFKNKIFAIAEDVVKGVPPATKTPEQERLVKIATNLVFMCKGQSYSAEDAKGGEWEALFRDPRTKKGKKALRPKQAQVVTRAAEDVEMGNAS